MSIQLRDYQEKAIDSIATELDGHQSTLVVMPTGSGKTLTFAGAIDRLSKKRSMVIAHREELIFQAQQKIRQVTGSLPEIEMASLRASRGIFGSRIIVASVQSLISGSQNGRRRFEDFDPREFDLIITDEAHRCQSNSFKMVLKHFLSNCDCKCIGVTATPDRSDEKALGQIFDSVAMNYEISDAIDDGWLTPIVQRFITVQDLDLSRCRTTAGDLNGADLAEALEYESVLHEMAIPTIEICGDRKAIIFTASVAQAERLCEIINLRYKPGSARWVCGETPKEVRRDLIAAYAAKQFQFFVNCGIFLEGFDDPGTEVIVMGRPTKSRSLFAQAAGRGFRPLPGIVDGLNSAEERRSAIAASKKPFAEILDFVGVCGKHKLVTTADILGGNYDDDVIELAERKAKESGAAVDMREALKDAAKQRHDEKERAKQIEAARRLNIKASVKYSSQKISPFDVFDLTPQRERGWDKGRPLSDKQRQLLLKQGIDPSTLNTTEAKQILGRIVLGFQQNLASFKQSKIIQKFGLPTNNLSRKQASEWIDAIAKNDWRLPAELNAVAVRR